MMQKLKVMLSEKSKSYKASLLVAGITMTPFMARAADGDVDTSAIVSKIVSMGTAAGTIGLAYLTVVLGVKAFKLLRSAA